MPLPERYEKAVPVMAALWGTEGTFSAQGRVWAAQAQARHELFGEPSAEDLKLISKALVLRKKDIAYLSIPEGHETNRFLRLVTGRLPAHLSRFVHRGNTSRDLLDTATALQIVESLDLLEADFLKLSNVLLALSFAHMETLQIARTHGQHAVIHTFGRQVLGWYSGNERSLDRIRRAREVISFGKGSGEVGTNIFIEPEIEERSLKILKLKPEPAPTQLIPRDRHAEVVSLMAVNGTELARVARNIQTYGRTEIGELQEPFDEKKQDASSSMPGKINTELAERVLGLHRRVKSASSEAYDSMVVPDEGDMSNSSIERFTFPDLFGCLAYQVQLMNIIFQGLHVNTERMASNIEVTSGAVYASRVLNHLLDVSPMPRMEAYDLVKGLWHQARRRSSTLRLELMADQRVAEYIPGGVIDVLFDPYYYLKNVDVAYRRLSLLEAA